ncbi:MAG: ribosomal protein S4 [Parcubacteria bacterium C7867-002]|nr:MAG: ribosomal protein S4 [Parcubacteria bacterium C7867-002]
MIIGPRYKKARYLGAPVFRKTQTQKFAIRSQQKVKKGGMRSNKSEFGRQLLEKQKARYSYGVSGGQFTNYVKKALATKGDNAKNLLHLLEGRLDNVVLRAGFAQSHSAARQMVAHGHLMVNGKGVNIPSYEVRIGDIISIREGSKKKTLFAKLEEQVAANASPAWIKVNVEKKEIIIDGEPSTDMTSLLFNVRSVLEFYTR